MSLEIIKSVKKAEEQAELIKQRSVEESRQIIADAHSQAQEYEMQSLLQVDEDNKKIITDAQQDAAQEISKLQAKTTEQAQVTKNQAAPQLEHAVDIIVERVVGFHGSH